MIQGPAPLVSNVLLDENNFWNVISFKVSPPDSSSKLIFDNISSFEHAYALKIRL